METKYDNNKNCQIYSYFGIFSKEDIKLISSLLNFFQKDLYLKHFLPEVFSRFNNRSRNFECQPFYDFEYVLDFYEKKFFLKDADMINSIKNVQVDIFESKKEFYKKLLKEYHIGLNIDEIVNMISTEKSLKNKLDGITTKDSKNFKKQCSLIVFLITKKYLNSELFDNHWKEANETKKDIVIFLLEQDLELSQDQFMNYKVLNIIDFMKKLNSSFKYSKWKLEEKSDDENAFYEFIITLVGKFVS
jgi:hypothetical protein